MPDQHRVKHMGEHIMKMSSSLEATRQSWAAQRLQEQAKTEKEEKAQAIKALRILRKMGLLEEAFSNNQEKAQELVNKGAAEVGPELPEGFGVKVRLSVKKVQEELSIQSKTKAWQKEKLETMPEENKNKMKHKEKDEGNEKEAASKSEKKDEGNDKKDASNSA